MKAFTSFNRTLYFILVTSSLYFLSGCSKNNDLAGGTGVETENGIAGIIKDENGPVEGAIVIIYPEKFNPVTDLVPSFLRTETKEDGKYLFKVPATGTYNIHATHLEKNTSGTIQNIELSDLMDEHYPAPEIILGTSGSITLYLQELNIVEGGYLFIPGSGIKSKITSQNINTGVIQIENIPASTYASINYLTPDLLVDTMIITQDFIVQSGELKLIGPYQAWGDTTKLYINTTVSGADIVGDALNFPLLVRLGSLSNSATLFEKSLSDGSDIRFAKSDGTTPLNFEIELWDSASQLADIWISLDTIYGNNNSQYIYMYTGAKNASVKSSTKSSPSDVFNTDAGYAAVWHFNEEGNTQPGGYKDASGNGHHGTGSGMVEVNEQTGILGKAQFFEGSNQSIEAPCPTALNGKNDFTVSFWMNYTPMENRVWILYFGGEKEFEAFHFLIDTNQNAQIGVWDTTNLLHNVFDLNQHNGVWAYITTIYTADNGLITSYLNGLEQATNTVNSNNILVEDGLHIGRYSINSSQTEPLGQMETNYQGSLDELRMSNKARSPAWIKLNYETQKAGASVVSIAE